MKKIIDQLNIDQWVNGDPNYLNEIQGQPVLLHFFQMLCPACVVQSLPLMQALWDRRSQHGMKILVIHSVFEHHEHMNALALKAFLSEFRYTFPVAIDAAGAGRFTHKRWQNWAFRVRPVAWSLTVTAMNHGVILEG